MRKVLLLALVVLMSNVYGQSKSYDYCYSGGKGVYVYSIADKSVYPILSGINATDLCIAPDGMKVAYTLNLKDGGRNIAVIDLNTNQKTILNAQSNNCFGPMWSPDGKYIAYNVFDNGKSNWSVAIIGTAPGSVPQVLTAQLTQCFAPTWTSDSKSVVVQDMSTVYRFDLSGNISATFNIADMTKIASPSSSDRFLFTGDGNKIVFSGDVDEPGFSDGPPAAVFIYDIASKTTLRILPKGYYADGIWLKGDQVLISGGNIKAKSENIYAVDLDGKNLKILFPKASGISAKN
jgi:TolB protein